MRVLNQALILLVCVCLGVSGCGSYTWTSRLDGNVERTVRFETVENRLFPHRPGFEYALTERLKEEIAVDRRLVFTTGAADVRLKVALIRFDEPTLVEDLETGERAEIQLRVRALVEAKGDAFVGGRVSRKVSVATSYTPLLGDSREAGLVRLWRDLSREILDVAADVEWTNP